MWSGVHTVFLYTYVGSNPSRCNWSEWHKLSIYPYKADRWEECLGLHLKTVTIINLDDAVVPLSQYSGLLKLATGLRGLSHVEDLGGRVGRY